MGQTFVVEASRVTWTNSGVEIVILDLEGSQYFALNESGCELWPLLVDGTSRDDMIAKLVDEYEISEDVAAQDVDALLDGLLERNIVKVADGSS